MSNSSAHSDSSASSSSRERILLPPVGPVSQKKTIEYIDGTKKVDKVKLAEWMNGIGNLYGSFELRENVTNLHMQLVPAIETLNKVAKVSSDKLKKEIDQLIEQYTILAVVCEKMLDKMEKPADFNNAEMLFEEKKHVPETPK